MSRSGQNAGGGFEGELAAKNHQCHKTRRSKPPESSEVSDYKIKSLTGYSEPPKLFKIHVFISSSGNRKNPILATLFVQVGSLAS